MYGGDWEVGAARLSHARGGIVQKAKRPPRRYKPSMRTAIRIRRKERSSDMGPTPSKAIPQPKLQEDEKPLLSSCAGRSNKIPSCNCDTRNIGSDRRLPAKSRRRLKRLILRSPKRCRRPTRPSARAGGRGRSIRAFGRGRPSIVLAKCGDQLSQSIQHTQPWSALA